jgi:uncharacterized protein with GYD domain
MPKYLVLASYTPEGLKGLQKDKASGRREATRQAVESLGGKVEAYYYAFGEHDTVSIFDFPDNVAASAFSLAVSKIGLVRTRTIPLLTVEESDKALDAAVKYRAPGL